MSGASVVIRGIFFFYFVAHMETKFFLVKVESIKTNTNRRAIGEDYGAAINGGFFSIDVCNNNCYGKCVEDSTYLFGFKSYRCETVRPEEPNNNPEKPTNNPEEPTNRVEPITTKPQTTTTQNGCGRTPRNHKRNMRMRMRRRKLGRNQEPWGFYVDKGRAVEGNSFCCTRGRRIGALVRSRRGCKPRTPRKTTG